MPVTNLPFIEQQMIRYGMTIYLALGIVGNIGNCIVFTHHSYRRTASSIYFLSLSIFAIIYLIWSVSPFMYMLNYTDFQTQSVLYCKMRLYISVSLGECLRYFVVFACADRFFVTRTNIRIRSLHSISVAIKFVFIISVVCFSITMHLPIFMNIRNNICGTVGLYKLLYAVYQITIVGILPPLLMSIFSILTIRSLYQQHGALRRLRQRDRYLMRMVMAEVMANVSISIPYSINIVYGAATFYDVDKSARRLEIEAFITFVTQFIIYLAGVVPFYLFLLTSKPFRRGFINITIKCWKKCVLRQARIVPLNVQNNAVTNNDQVTSKRQRTKELIR